MIERDACDYFFLYTPTMRRSRGFAWGPFASLPPASVADGPAGTAEDEISWDDGDFLAWDEGDFIAWD